MMLIQTQTGKSDKQRICSLTCYEVGRYLLSGLGFLEQQTGYHSKWVALMCCLLPTPNFTGPDMISWRVYIKQFLFSVKNLPLVALPPTAICLNCFPTTNECLQCVFMEKCWVIKGLYAINWYDTCISSCIRSSKGKIIEFFWFKAGKLQRKLAQSGSGIILTPHSPHCTEQAGRYTWYKSNSSTSSYWIQIFTSWLCSNVRQASVQRDSHWSRQTACDQLVMFRHTGRQLVRRVFSTMFSRLSSGSPVSSYRDVWKTQSQPPAPSWAGSQ